MKTPKRLRTDRRASLVLSALVLIAAFCAVLITIWFSLRGATEQNQNLQQIADTLRNALMLLTVVLSSYMLYRQSRALDETRFRAMTENAHHITLIFNPDGSHRYTSPALKLLVNSARARQVRPDEYIHPDDLAKLQKAIEASMHTTDDIHLDSLRCQRHDHQWRTMEAEFVDMRHISGVNGIVANLRDVTEQREAEQSMRILSGAVEQSHGAVMITDKNSIIKYVNPRYCQITGYTKEELIGETARLLEFSDTLDNEQRGMRECISVGKSWTVSMRGTRKNGESYWQAVSASPVIDESGTLTHIVVSVEDTSQQREIHAQMEQLAFYDPLTGLENRRLFKDRLDQCLKQVRRSKQLMALLFLDLDGFKTINDTLGHDAGDELLIIIARRLKQCVREEDIVARLGGDEFTIILSNLKSNKAASSVASKIIQKIQKPVEIAGQEVFISCSIGITIAPNDSMDANILMRNADLAMYRAKDLGKNNSQYFTDDMNLENEARNGLENALRAALTEESFVVYFQPQVDISAHRISGFEALVRWQHPEGDLLPARFIPLAEETGLIIELGEIILRKTCEQMNALHEAGFTDQKVSVNLTERQFRDKNLINMIRSVFAETDFDPRGLQIEITESMLMRDIDKAIDIMQQLKRLGVSIAIDDFGTGFSSLTNLARLPVDTLKVDHRFIKQLTASEDENGITSSVIALAKHMRMTVAAEGVESPEQREFLRQNHCSLQQGFLFCAPVAIGDLIPHLARLQADLKSQDLSH